MTQTETSKVSDQPRKTITVNQAKNRFRKSIFTDEDLARKSGLSRQTIQRFWGGEMPYGMSWRGIAGVLEQMLGPVRIKKP